MTLGDLIICYSFDNKELPNDFKCLNIENEIREAKVNDGTESEVFHYVNLVSYKVAYDNLINLNKEKTVDCEEKRILNIWKEIRYSIVILPKKPSDFFIKTCMKYIHGDDVKVGDKCTPMNYAKSIAKALQEVYGITLK